MGLKCVLLFTILLIAIAQREVAAAFYPDPEPPTAADLKGLGLKCIPGRTIMKVSAQKPQTTDYNSGESGEDDDVLGDDDDEDGRRSHMNFAAEKDELCLICVCSNEGKDEYCSKRPAKNVNECMRMATLTDDFKKNMPFDLERVLSQAIRRRDYVWHKDELPLPYASKCLRGSSYYTNREDPEEAENLNVETDVEGYLGDNPDSNCTFCVCSVSGAHVECMHRQNWVCDYYRKLKREGIHEMYTELFRQDRPPYFYQLSYRIRRTMDQGVFDILDGVGSSLAPSSTCFPFLSEYTDCTDANSCTGCNKCTCNAFGQWDCRMVYDCEGTPDYQPIGDQNLENALEELQTEIFNHKKSSNNAEKFHANLNKEKNGNLLDGHVKDEDDNGSIDKDDDDDGTLDKEILALLRRKRSVENEPYENEPDANETTVYHNVVDELNEDTLKYSNDSGRIELKKIEPAISRRTDKVSNNNVTDPHSLHIEHNQPQSFTNHITDDNLDKSNGPDTIGKLSHEKLNSLLQNKTQKDKDHSLSKIIVNELKTGSEVVGDANAPVISNITFTPENDTLTAMAFIAGNLLNKLWNLENEETEDTIETELLKHQKLSDLLDLFKEPLSMRQETFLRNALFKLSEVVNKNKDIDNVTLCENLKDIKNTLAAFNNISNLTETEYNTNETKRLGLRNLISENGTEPNVGTKEAVANIQNVLNLFEKFGRVKSSLNSLKNNEPNKAILSENEDESLDQFGKILEKITKFLMPDKSSQKRTIKKLRANYKKKSDETVAKIKKLFNVDLTDANLTSKDQLLLGYLSKIENIPDCSLSSKITEPLILEGDIMRNLSEFMKIKSYIDLMKLIKQNEKKLLTTTTTETPKQMIGRTGMTEPNLLKTKEKLKEHLRSIIEDLSEIQKAKGSPTNNVTIENLLPCVHNLLYNDDAVPKSSLEKIKNLFDDLRADLKGNVLQTRRNLKLEPRPKSAKVLERMVKTLDKLNKQKTRRTLDVKPSKSYQELKKAMKSLEQTGSMKRYTAFSLVPPSEKLLLLKTLQMNVRRYYQLLDDISHSTSNYPNLLEDNSVELQRFLKIAITNIISSHNLFREVHNAKNTRRLLQNNAKNTRRLLPNNAKNTRRLLQNTQISDDTININNPLLSKFIKERHNVKLSREQLMKHLIRNRVEKFLSLQKNQRDQPEEDGSSSIAKRILWYLNHNNFELAKQLYKAFIVRKVESQEEISDSTTKRAYEANYFGISSSMNRFEESQPSNDQSVLLNQDNLLKQLLNIKNLRSS